MRVQFFYWQLSKAAALPITGAFPHKWIMYSVKLIWRERQRKKQNNFHEKKWKGAVSNWFTVENNNDLLLAYNLNVVYVQKVYNFRYYYYLWCSSTICSTITLYIGEGNMPLIVQSSLAPQRPILLLKEEVIG